MRTRRVSIGLTLEELEFKSLFDELIGVEVTVYGTVDPGEPMVRYYADGSGYPGSPPTFDYESCVVTKAWGENWEYERMADPVLFDKLDSCVNARIYDMLDEIQDRVLEQVHDDDYDYEPEYDDRDEPYPYFDEPYATEDTADSYWD